MNERNFSTVVLGDVNVDVIMRLENYPSFGRDSIIPQAEVGLGGSATNCAVSLHRMGLNVHLAGCVGNDPWGGFILERMAETGLETSLIKKITSLNTGIIFLAITPDGERTMFSARGANVFAGQDLIPLARRGLLNWLHVSGYALVDDRQAAAVLDLMKNCSEMNIPVSLDTGLDPVVKNRSSFIQAINYINVCITGLEESRVLFGSPDEGRAVEDFLQAGVDLVGVKLGEKGSLLSNGRETLRMPAFPVKAIDTTGAGDAYSAGLIFACQNGFTLLQSGLLAGSLSARATLSEGAGNQMPGKKDLIEFLSRYTEESLQGISPAEIEKLAVFLQSGVT